MSCECVTTRGKRCKKIAKFKTNSYGVFINTCGYHKNSNPIYKWSLFPYPDTPEYINRFLEFYNQVTSYKLHKWLNVMITSELYDEKKINTSIEKLLKSFFKKVLKSSESFSECSICLSDDTSSGVVTRCGHTFCKDCIIDWVMINPVCPLCREFISCFKLKKDEDES